MRIHRAGQSIFIRSFVAVIVLNVFFNYYGLPIEFRCLLAFLSLVLILIIVTFYRNPMRYYTNNYTNNNILASADGRIVAIEEVEENEYFKEKRILVAIFMTPLNVHVNWYPITGNVLYVKHHTGRYQAAYLPKASTENERSSVVIETECGANQILVRQIAGAMARRIVTYASVGDKSIVNKHLGFIKLGSRVDIYLPLNSKIRVSVDERVKGNHTVLAELCKH